MTDDPPTRHKIGQGGLTAGYGLGNARAINQHPPAARRAVWPPGGHAAGRRRHEAAEVRRDTAPFRGAKTMDLKPPITGTPQERAPAKAKGRD